MEIESSITFHGSGFRSVMFDDRSLFGGSIGERTIRDDFASISYCDGKYRLRVAPESVTLEADDTSAIPSDLVLAARTIASAIEATVSANAETAIWTTSCVFGHESGEQSGEEFCRSFIAVRDVEDRAKSSVMLAYPCLLFFEDVGWFEVTLTPDPQDEDVHSNLRVTVRAGRPVGAEGDTLTALLGRTDDVRSLADKYRDMFAAWFTEGKEDAG